MEKIYYCFINLDNKNFDFIGFTNNRIDYINSITDNRRKNQSYYVWKLLLFALQDLGITNKLQFSCKNGKWFIVNSKIHFSLSHSDNIVAVVVSDKSVGIDVEKVLPKSLKLQKRYQKIDKEFDSLDLHEKMLFLTKKWTEEECSFKNPSTFNKVYSTIIKDSIGTEFVLSCTSDEIPKEILLEI